MQNHTSFIELEPATVIARCKRAVTAIENARRTEDEILILKFMKHCNSTWLMRLLIFLRIYDPMTEKQARSICDSLPTDAKILDKILWKYPSRLGEKDVITINALLDIAKQASLSETKVNVSAGDWACINSWG